MRVNRRVRVIRTNKLLRKLETLIDVLSKKKLGAIAYLWTWPSTNFLSSLLFYYKFIDILMNRG